MNRHALSAIVSMNVVVAGLATGWAYCSHIYDRINIAGGAGDPGFWDSVGAVASFATLLSWVVAVFITLSIARGKRMTSLRRLTYLITSLGAGPVAFFAAGWVFGLGLPPPQV